MITESYDKVTGMWYLPDTLALLRRARTVLSQDKRSDLSAPQVCSDIPDYQSPVSGNNVSGRVARREDLKRSNCREVDPSEHTVSFRSDKMARKYGRKSA